jgi:hypothetical protein
VREAFDAIYYLPVGEKDRIDYVSDSIEAIYFHNSPRTKIILMDDSGVAQHGKKLQTIFPDVDVFLTDPKFQGKGLAGRHGFETVRTLKYAVEKYEFKVIIRHDTDALVTADGLDQDLIALFAKDPSVGILGRHWMNCEGYYIDRGVSRHFMKRLNSFPYRFYFLRSVTHLNRLVRRANRNGYITGELVLGCCTGYSYECAFRLAAFIDDFKGIRGIRGLAEDYFTTLFVKYVNMNLGDASDLNGPMALELVGIPMELEKVVEQNRKIIHSVKNDPRYTQEEIREFFRNRRQNWVGEKKLGRDEASHASLK